MAAEARSDALRERPPRSTRLLTAAIGLAASTAVIVAMIAMTPWNVDPSTENSRPRTTVFTRLVSGLSPESLHPIVIPLAESALAVALSHTLDNWSGAGDTARPETVVVMLPDGDLVEGRVLDPGGDEELAVIELPEPKSIGLVPAPRPPVERDLVTILFDEPMTVEFRRLDSVGAAFSELVDGTIVVDDEGRLLGLCRRTSDGISFVSVDRDVARRYRDR